MQKFNHSGDTHVLWRYHADIGLTALVFIWGFHFIVLKDAFDNFNPVTFNALRYVMAFPVLAFIARSNPHIMKLESGDLRKLFMLVMVGPVLYQILTMLGLNYTTTTNASLLTTTTPAWVALFSILLKRIEIRKWLFFGLGMTILGVTLVILNSSSAGVSLSRHDLPGSAMALSAAILLGIFTIRVKPVLDRNSAIGVSIWIHLFVMVALLLISSPDIAQLRPNDFPREVWPHFLYSALIASIMGRMMYNYGVKTLGATRAAAYQNFVPLVTAITAVIILGERITIGLFFGGLITLIGVALTRRNTIARKHGQPPLELSPSPSTLQPAGTD